MCVGIYIIVTPVVFRFELSCMHTTFVVLEYSLANDSSFQYVHILIIFCQKYIALDHWCHHSSVIQYTIHRRDGLVVRASASRTGGRGFKPRSGHTKDYKNSTFSPLNQALGI